MKYILNKEDVTFKILDGETVLINKKSSYFYTLNKTATFIWELLVENELSLEEITENVACHYQKDEREIGNDIAKFIAGLSKEHLVKTAKISSATKKNDRTVKQAKDYEIPKLTKYEKLEKLFVAAV